MIEDICFQFSIRFFGLTIRKIDILQKFLFAQKVARLASLSFPDFFHIILIDIKVGLEFGFRNNAAENRVFNVVGSGKAGQRQPGVLSSRVSFLIVVKHFDKFIHTNNSIETKDCCSVL